MNSELKKMFAKLDAAIHNAITVPNSWLPEEYHNKKTGQVSLARLDKKCDRRDGVTDHKKLKAEKARRIENYRQQVETNGTFEYINVDEHKLYKNQMAFAKYCPSINLEVE